MAVEGRSLKDSSLKLLEEKSLKYLKVNPDGISVHDRSFCPSSEELATLLGQSAPLHRANYLRNIFTDLSLLVLCSNGINRPWVAKTHKGEHLFGTLLILREIPLDFGFELSGLGEHQILLVHQQLSVKRSVGVLTASQDLDRLVDLRSLDLDESYAPGVRDSRTLSVSPQH
jgi:hypothetical protein